MSTINPQEFKAKINTIITINLLNPNLKGDLIAQEIGVNRMFIHRKLKHYYNTNARDYILQKRIEYAKKELMNTDRSIQSIAEDLHFYDTPHFSKTFKKFVNRSPSVYKKRNT